MIISQGIYTQYVQPGVIYPTIPQYGVPTTFNSIIYPPHTPLTIITKLPKKQKILTRIINLPIITPEQEEPPKQILLQTTVNRQNIQLANESLYYIIKSYKRLIKQFLNHQKAIQKGVESEIRFENKRTSFMMENFYIIFKNCEESFPKDDEYCTKEYKNLIKSIKADFNNLAETNPVNSSSLRNQMGRFKDLLEKDVFYNEKREDVKYIEPKLLLPIFSQMQISLHEMELKMNELRKKDSFLTYKLESKWL